jgi:hypothetical protein
LIDLKIENRELRTFEGERERRGERESSGSGSRQQRTQNREHKTRNYKKGIGEIGV